MPPKIHNPNDQVRTEQQKHSIEAIGSLLQLTRTALKAMPAYCKMPAIMLLEQLVKQPHNIGNMVCSAAIVNGDDDNSIVEKLTLDVGQIALLLLQLYNPPAEQLSTISGTKPTDFERN